MLLIKISGLPEQTDKASYKQLSDEIKDILTNTKGLGLSELQLMVEFPKREDVWGETDRDVVIEIIDNAVPHSIETSVYERVVKLVGWMITVFVNPPKIPVHVRVAKEGEASWSSADSKP